MSAKPSGCVGLTVRYLLVVSAVAAIILIRLEPRRRRRWAARLLIASIVLWLANRVLYLTGLMSHAALDSITNDLSWLALTFTAVDIVSTTDVRKQQETP